VAKKKVAKKATKVVRKKTRAARRGPLPKAGGSAPDTLDVRVLLAGIEDWVRYVRELIESLPAGTKVHAGGDIEPPGGEIPPMKPGKCFLLSGPTGPRLPEQMTVRDLCRILTAIEHWIRDVRERIGPPTPPRPR